MLLLKNGTIYDPKSREIREADILIKDGKIARIGMNLEKELADSQQVQILDVAGRQIGPGLVDVHVHFRDPGFTYKEDIETGARAAARGGFTTVVLMANTKPAVDTVETLSYVLEKGKQTGIKVETCATVTQGLQGKVLTDMRLLREKGAAGFTDDGIPILEEGILRQAFAEAAKLGAPVSLHEEDPAYITNNGVNRGKASEYFGIGGSDRKAEIALVERDTELALEAGAILNVQHISTREAVEIVRQAKKRGKGIHAEATPHHFSLTEEALIRYGTLAKMNPPLRTEDDRKAILEGLKDGTIDIIATDHAPHSQEEKEKALTEAPSGITGLETAFSLAVTNLVKPGELALLEVLDRMSFGPANLYGFDRGYLAEGAEADLIVFDTEETVKYDQFFSKSSNTPFAGETLYGKIQYTICHGEIVYSA